MKYRILFFISMVLGVFYTLDAQIVVDQNTAKFLRDFDDEKVKPAHIDTSYWSTSARVKFMLNAWTVSDNWYNTSIRSTFKLNVDGEYNANYKREFTRWNNKIFMKLGFQWEDAADFADGARNLSVSNNYLQLSTEYGVKLVRKFDFVANVDLTTQILASYKNNTAKEPNKQFMAPGTLNIGAGAKHSHSAKRFNITTSFYPINANMTLVLDERLADAGTSGVRPAEKDANGNIIRHGAKSKTVFGGRMSCDLKWIATKDKKMTIENKLSYFMGYTDGFGKGQMNDFFSIAYKFTKNLEISYNLQLRYFDNEHTFKKVNVTQDNGSIKTITEEHGATLQMRNDISLNLVFNF